MQFGSVRVDPDAWKQTGTVTGVHTYDNTILMNENVPIAQVADETNTVKFEDGGVVIAQNLRVMGNLVAPGFPPLGPDNPLPPNPTFNVVNTNQLITHGNGIFERIHVTGDAQVDGGVTADRVEADRFVLPTDGTIGNDQQVSLQLGEDTTTVLGTWNFAAANVEGLDPGNSYPSIMETTDRVVISKRVRLDSLGHESVHHSYHENDNVREIIFQDGDRNMFQMIYNIAEDKYQTINWAHESLVNTLKVSNITGMNSGVTFNNSLDFSAATQVGLFPSLKEYSDHLEVTRRLVASHVGWHNSNPINFHGNLKYAGATVDFTDATVIGLSGGGGTPYPSITETTSAIQMTKPLHVSVTETNVCKADSIHAINETLSMSGNIDFSNATVTGLPSSGNSYDSIEELSDRIAMYKRLDMGQNEVMTNYIGTDDAGIELDEAEKEIVMRINNRDMMWRIFANESDGSTNAMSYTSYSWMNHAYCHTFSPRPGYTQVDFKGVMDFADATVTGLYPGFSANADLHRLIVGTGTSLYFADSMSNPGIATQITELAVETNFVGRPNNGWYFQTFGPDNTGLIACKQAGQDVLFISPVEIVSTVPITTTKKGSSGNFTHCHLTEGAQATNWEVGRCVTSTGEYCARTDDGNLIANPSAAPDASHAMCKVGYSSKGDRALGIIASVEHVSENSVLHEHGGLTLKANIQENDGHAMVRVASSGDVMAWVVKPNFTEIDMPPLSGLWQKCVDNQNPYSGHTVLSNHVAIEADGYLSIDGQVIDTSTATVTVEADKVCVYPSDPTLTPELFSGVYNKTINGIMQDIQVVMHCNQDYSFSFSEHFPGFEARVAALEATIAELTGPD